MIDTFKRIAETLGWVGGMLYLVDFVILKWTNWKLQRALQKLAPPPMLCVFCTLPLLPGEATIRDQFHRMAHLSCHATRGFKTP